MGSMTSSSPTHLTQTPPARFVSLDFLIGPDGPIPRTLFPAPSRRSLLRRLRAAGVPRFKLNGPCAPGRSAVYFDQAAVSAWLDRNAGKETKV
jgi:hypothetical protein